MIFTPLESLKHVLSNNVTNSVFFYLRLILLEQLCNSCLVSCSAMIDC